MSADNARKTRKRTSSETSFGSGVGDEADGAIRKRKKYELLCSCQAVLLPTHCLWRELGF